MKQYVVLVNPPYRTKPHQHPPFPPLGLGYLAAVLEKNHYKVEVIDCQACSDSFGVSDELETIGIAVRYVGPYITEMLKAGWYQLTF